MDIIDERPEGLSGLQNCKVPAQLRNTDSNANLLHVIRISRASLSTIHSY